MSGVKPFLCGDAINDRAIRRHQRTEYVVRLRYEVSRYIVFKEDALVSQISGRVKIQHTVTCSGVERLLVRIVLTGQTTARSLSIDPLQLSPAIQHAQH